MISLYVLYVLDHYSHSNNLHLHGKKTTPIRAERTINPHTWMLLLRKSSWHSCMNLHVGASTLVGAIEC